MKRALIYIGTLIIITGLLILFVDKNYPENIIEFCLNEYISPEDVDRIVKDLNAFDYFNVYEIFSKEGTASVYSGNLNLFLYNKKVQGIGLSHEDKEIESEQVDEEESSGLTYEDKEVIIGDKFIDKNFKYYPLGTKYTSVYGEYDVNGILEGSDRIYYRDLEILKTARIKSQKIYLSVINTKKIMMLPSIKVHEAKFYGMNIGKSIAYKDLSDSLKKVAALLIIVMAFLVFAVILRLNKKIFRQIVSSYKGSKYDLDIKDFIIKRDNLKIIIKQIFAFLLQVLSIIFILYSVSSFTNVPVSYNIDISSLKSITDAITSLTDLLKYYHSNGFTEISWMIVKIIMIYVSSSMLFLIIMLGLNKKFAKK